MLLFVTVWVSLLAGPVASQAPEPRLYTHAYYLFIAPPANACEACYIPLLLTSESLDQVARTKQDQTGLVITTYERDSIVGAPREVTVTAADVRPQERQVRVANKGYRYQEIGSSEVLALLARPEGTIPIHRTMGMGVPTVDALAGIRARLRMDRASDGGAVR